MEHVASTMERLMSENVNHRRLYLIQTYGIGKERVFIEVRPPAHQKSSVGCCTSQVPAAAVKGLMPDAGMHVQVARRCNIKLYCSERKRGVMECLDMPGEPAHWLSTIHGHIHGISPWPCYRNFCRLPS